MIETASTSNLDHQVPSTQKPSKESLRWFAILCIIALLTVLLHKSIQVHQVSRDSNFEFLLFSQQWPSGQCATHGHCDKNDASSFFTIHGLWPSNATSWPENCNLSLKFDINTLNPIRNRLDEFWPSISGAKGSKYFWSHEWYKHGSCATSIPELRGELNYFNKTLDLLRLYNITMFFSENGIVPSQTKPYSIDTLLRTLNQDPSSEVHIVCGRVKGLPYPVLTEVRYCLSKTTFKPIHCNIKHENCGDGQILYLPVDSIKKPIVQGWLRLLVRLFSIYSNYLSPV